MKHTQNRGLVSGATVYQCARMSIAQTSDVNTS